MNSTYIFEPVFPIVGEEHLIQYHGMTLQEYYAGLAMQALISKSPYLEANPNDRAYKLIAKSAMAYANALIEVKDL